jgi:hypothetical protein
VLVAWLQIAPFANGIRAATLSADARTVRHEPQLIEQGSPTVAFAGVTGRFYEVVGPAHTFIYDDDLVLQESTSVADWTSAAVSVHGDTAFGNVSDITGVCWGTCAMRTYSATFTTPWRTVRWDYSVFYAGNPIRTALIAPQGDFFVGVVQTSVGDGIVTEITPGADGTSHNWRLERYLPTVNAIAGNGSDVLLLWNLPLRGMLLHADGTASTVFPIANDGYAPKIIAASANEFVVAYRRDLDSNAAVFAGRVIRLQAGHQRASR